MEIYEYFFNFTGDFPGAIQLLFEAKDAAKTYSHFRAIQQLSHNLQDTLELAEEQLDVALSKVCIDFKESTYARLQVLLYSFKIRILWECFLAQLGFRISWNLSKFDLIQATFILFFSKEGPFENIPKTCQNYA